MYDREEKVSKAFIDLPIVPVMVNDFSCTSAFTFIE